MTRILGTVLALALVLTASAYGGANEGHTVAIHVISHGSTTCTKGFPAIDDCEDVVYEYESCDDIDVFPVFLDLSGVTGIQYGLTWPSAWGSCAYTACVGDFTIGDIEDPGDGIAHSWSECQNVSIVVAGYGWLSPSGSGLVCPTLNPRTYKIGTSDCDFVEDSAYETYCAGVCGGDGEDPCPYPTGRNPSTWGKIKRMFR
jgi:hypothetical protein